MRSGVQNVHGLWTAGTYDAFAELLLLVSHLIHWLLWLLCGVKRLGVCFANCCLDGDCLVVIEVDFAPMSLFQISQFEQNLSVSVTLVQSFFCSSSVISYSVFKRTKQSRISFISILPQN